MKTYVTFGQVHVHRVNGKTFDKDSVAVIERETSEEGRLTAMVIFDGKFHQTFYDELPAMKYFPRGLIEVE
jgi:hypothetical protein